MEFFTEKNAKLALVQNSDVPAKATVNVIGDPKLEEISHSPKRGPFGPKFC